MRSFKDINEARGDNTAVFTFGRFNPPTTGHGKLLDALAKQAKKNGAMTLPRAITRRTGELFPVPLPQEILWYRPIRAVAH